MKKVLLIGSIGNPNVGDEAILESNLELINNIYDGNVQFYIMTKNSAYTSLLFKDTSYKIVCCDFLHRLSVLNNYDRKKIENEIRNIIKYDGELKYNYYYSEINTIVKNVDCIHIIGGGYFSSRWKDIILEIWCIVKLAQKYQKQYILTGISVDLYDNFGRILFKEICKNAEFVDFRDKRQYQLYNSINANTIGTTDDTLGLNSADIHIKKGKYINVLFHEWNNKVLLEWKFGHVFLPVAIELLKNKTINYINVLSFSIGDISSIELYKNKIPEELLDKFKIVHCEELRPAIVKRIVGSAYFNIGTRFHQAFFSLSEGVPVYSIFHEKYYKEKIECAHRSFQSNSYCSLDEFSLPSFYEFIKTVADKKYQLKINKTIALNKYYRKIKFVKAFYKGNMEEKNMKKISVIIPVYNTALYLRKCLDSIFSQTIDDFEVICVNDGSVDNSLEILEEYKDKYRNVIIINQANKGVAKARNRALKIAKGKYVYFIDSDDWLYDNFVLEKLYNAAENNNVLIAGGGFYECNDKYIKSSWNDINSKYTFKKNGIINYEDYQFDYGWVRFIYNREFLIKNNLFIPERLFFEDPVFFVRVMSKAKQFYAINEPVYCYRTGHHGWELSEIKVLDLLKGVKEIVKLSNINDYMDLIGLEIYRLTHDYSRSITKYFASSKDIQLELKKIDFLIGGELIEFFIRSSLNEINTVYNSYNWKVGKFILYIPKKLVSFFR